MSSVVFFLSNFPRVSAWLLRHRLDGFSGRESTGEWTNYSDHLGKGKRVSTSPPPNVDRPILEDTQSIGFPSVSISLISPHPSSRRPFSTFERSPTTTQTRLAGLGIRVVPVEVICAGVRACTFWA
jgi:hypothetical protein